jgi:SAM-dependent methyltransferase
MSSQPADSIADVVAELQAALNTVAMTGETTGGDDRRPDTSHLSERALSGLTEMSRVVGIPTDPQITTRKSPLAPIRVAFKAPIRKAIRWYVSPVATQTRWFADATLETVTALVHEVRRLGDENVQLRAGLERDLSGLRDRLGRLERERLRPATPAQDQAPSRPDVAAIPVPVGALDYLAFEGLARGSTSDIADRQRPYLECFAGVDDILDVGCGRGEFLGLLRSAGKRASGVDRDADMVGQCQEAGLDVTLGDATGHLAGLGEDSLGGIFAAQVVEHMPPGPLIAFLEAAARALRPGGVIALETINPASLSALRNYFSDLTHAQPLVAETLAFLVESAGFRDVEVRFTSVLPAEGRLQAPAEGDLPGPAGAAVRRNVELLNALLFAPQDYAIIAHA